MPTWTTRLKGLATLLASLILTVYILDQKGVLVYDGAALLPQLLPEILRKWFAAIGIVCGILGVSPLGRLVMKDPSAPMPPLFKKKDSKDS